MLFLYVISLLYFTQLTTSQIISESEAINKIISDILIKSEKKNSEKKNDDPVEFLWNDVMTIDELRPSRYTLRSSKKPKTELNPFLRSSSQNDNPTLKLHDILPELTFYTQPLRLTRKNAKKTTKTVTKTSKTTKQTTKTASKTTKPTVQTQKLTVQTIKPTEPTIKSTVQALKPIGQTIKPIGQTMKPAALPTKSDEDKMTYINPSQKMKAIYDIKTTPFVKKTTKYTTTKKFNILTDDIMKNYVNKHSNIKPNKKPDPTEDVYSKNIADGPMDQAFSRPMFEPPKATTVENTADSNYGDKHNIMKEQKLAPFQNIFPPSKLADKDYAAKVTTKKSYMPYTTARTITEKDWSLLKDVEDHVKSVPNYKIKPLKPSKAEPKVQFDTTLKDYDEYSIDNIDLQLKHGAVTSHEFNVPKKQPTSTLASNVTEDKYTFYTPEMKSINDDAKIIDNMNEFNEKTTTKLDKKVPEEFEKLFTDVTTSKNTRVFENVNMTEDKDITEKAFDKRITVYKENYTFMTTEYTYPHENFAEKTFKNDDVDISVKADKLENDNDFERLSLDQLLDRISKISSTTTKKTTHGYDTYSESDNTEESKYATSAYITTSPISTDLYLLVEPKDKSLKSYFTLESMTTDKNTQSSSDDNYVKILSDLGIETTTEYSPNLSNKLPMNVEDVMPDTPAANKKPDASKKGDIADLYKDVIEKYETTKEEHMKDMNAEKLHEKIAKHLNWERIKKFFGHDRVCNCKCKANKTMCTVCAASDAVIRELAFEFNNLADYMNTHCTEIQTFFWMNPSGGKKLRDTVHRIDKTLQDYYKRVKGKCTGRTCKTFTTYLDKRSYSDKMNVRRKSLKELLRDLEVK